MILGVGYTPFFEEVLFDYVCVWFRWGLRKATRGWYRGLHGSLWTWFGWLLVGNEMGLQSTKGQGVGLFKIFSAVLDCFKFRRSALGGLNL